MREVDYGIATLEPDAYFKLLPEIAQVRDNGAVLAWCEALANAHNLLASKIRALPRLKDPFLCAAFTPGDFGESVDTFNTWLALQQQNLTAGQRTYVDSELATSIPNSIAAYNLEQDALRHLSSLAAYNFNGPRQLSASVRSMIASGISRSKLRGTHLALFMYGSYSGFYQIKATDLWGRFVPHDPTHILSTSNDGDFSETADVYPLAVNGGVVQTLRYGGNGIVTNNPESSQYPVGDPTYSPFVVDDSGLFNTVTYSYLGINRALPNWYNTIMNGNPFGKLLNDVLVHLIPGTFSLGGGSDNTKASVMLPAVNGGFCKFEAWTYGEYGNSISITVGINPNGLRNVSITGPLSLRKFKSSWVDLLTTFNPNLGAQFPILIPVWQVGDATSFDESLGRSLPGYPLTGTAGGSFVIADPATDYAIDQTQIDAINRDLLAEISKDWTPATRQIRSVTEGFCHIDQVTYAPITPINSVILSDTTGQLWQLQIVDQTPVWVQVSSGSSTEVFQQDLSDQNTSYEWMVDTNGNWVLQPYFGTRNDAVFINDGSVGGFVFIDSGIPQFSTSPPDSLSNAVHTEPSSYAGVIENPPVSARPFMSTDAVASDATNVLMQASPEDDLTSSGYLQDNAYTPIDPMFSDTMPVDDWGSRFAFDSNGQFIGQDLRNRFAGPSGAIVQASPLAPKRGNPMRVRNRHGYLTYRDRETQHVYKVKYKRDGTQVVTDLGFLDGPIEPTQNNANGPTLPTNGLAGPVGQIKSPGLPYEWMPDSVAELLPINRFTSVTGGISLVSCDDGAIACDSDLTTCDAGTGASLTVPDASFFSHGMDLFVRGSVYGGLTWCINGPYPTSINTVMGFVGNDSGDLYVPLLTLTPITPQEVTLYLNPDSAAVIKYIVYVDGVKVIDTSANVVFDFTTTFSVTGQLVRVFVSSPVTGICRLRATTPQNVTTGWGGQLCWDSSRQAVMATMLSGSDSHFYDV